MFSIADMPAKVSRMLPGSGQLLFADYILLCVGPCLAECIRMLHQVDMCCRSNSAHDLGEDIDPEMLPDLETLQESFDIPVQLRMEMPTCGEATQQQDDPTTSHCPHPSQQQRQPRARADSYQVGASQYGPEHHSGRNSGATTPSGPRSSASDESLHPITHYPYGSRPHQGAAGPLLEDLETAELSPAHLGHSRSMPLEDGFEGLTELQQHAADMLADVSQCPYSMPACMHACGATSP